MSIARPRPNRLFPRQAVKPMDMRVTPWGVQRDDRLAIRARGTLVDAHHPRLGRPVDIGVEQTDAASLPRECDREVRTHGGLSDPALARPDRENAVDPGDPLRPAPLWFGVSADTSETAARTAGGSRQAPSRRWTRRGQNCGGPFETTLEGKHRRLLQRKRAGSMRRAVSRHPALRMTKLTEFVAHDKRTGRNVASDQNRAADLPISRDRPESCQVPSLCVKNRHRSFLCPHVARGLL